LTANRQVENHRNLFPAIRATEGVFHRSMLQQVLVALCEKGVSDQVCLAKIGSI
jgi:hypothetical protein